ncbi:MAG: 50S ribosomal protein L15, partial [Candidatus Saccharibacteria bacterium]|nr:50S ribosomal protein L15 [Candidatus Saccharibacteria bacterium]
MCIRDRGTKGQMARTGKGKRPGFEGGQNPLAQRVPKLRGFRSYKTAAENVYTGQLDQLGATVDNQALADAKLVSNAHVAVKLIVKGEVTKKHTVKLQSASATAIAAIEKAGGTFAAVERVARPAKASKKDAKTE